MKKYTYLIAFMLGLFLFASCEKDEDKVIISANPTASALQSPSGANGMAFTKDDADNSIDFSWSASDFGFQASVTYGVQLALTDNFANAATIITTGELTGSARVSDINGVLLSFELEIDEPATVKCRVFATVGSGTDSTFSAITDFTVTPFETLIDYPMVYVPGAYQGWAPGDVNGRLFSYNFNTVYEGIIRISGSDPAVADENVEFKIAPAPNWDNSWGGTLTASGSDYSGTMDASGGNFSVVEGTYKFTVDTDALTIALEATDDWGIIGGAVPPYDWSADVDLFYNGQRQMWEITADFNAGDIKFRANDGWDLNYGSDNADGVLNAGGANIPLSAAGNYTIRADIENLTYQIIAN
jgi:hypothetical protein